MLSAGEGLFIAGGKTAALKAGSDRPSTFLHFFLSPAADLDRPETAPAAVRELYRTVAAIPDLVGGRVAMMFSPIPVVLPLVREGKLRALAVTSLTRSSAVPELPTIAEHRR